MASLTWWTWVWVNSGSWWWTGRPGVLRFMGLQRVGHDWVTDLIWSDLNMLFIPQVYGFSSFLWLCSCFILLWTDKILDIILVFLNILRLVLWSCIWFIVENVPWALEKNMYVFYLNEIFFCVSNNSTWSNALFKARISLLIFCLDHLPSDVSELLYSCTFIVLLFISPFMPVNICFICIGGICIGWIDSYKFGNKSWIHKKSIDIQISILCTFFLVEKSLCNTYIW